MKFKYKKCVTVSLKDCGYLHVYCTRIFKKHRNNEFLPDFYVFQLFDETVVQIPCGLVKEFSYFQSSFDIEPICFTYLSEED